MPQFPSLVNGRYPLGSNAHQQAQGAIPVWIVTDIFSNILISNQCSDGEGNPSWAVIKGRITVTRFWTASTAMIVCSIDNPQGSVRYPNLPNNLIRPRLQGGKVTYDREIKYPLDKNDEICIWGGYIETIRPVVAADFTRGNLLRMFVGVVDTIVGATTANQGTNIVIQCRDRMRYLMDSVSSYNTTDFAPIGLDRNVAQAKDGQNNVDVISKDGTIKRSEVIVEIARRSIGHLENSYSIKNGIMGSLNRAEGQPQSSTVEVSENPTPADGQVGLAQYCGSVCGMKISVGYVIDLRAGIGSPDDIYANFSYKRGEQEEAKRPYYGLRIHNKNEEIFNTNDGNTEQSNLQDTIPFIGGRASNAAGLSADSFDRDFYAIRARMPVMNIVTGRAAFELDSKRRNVAGMSPHVTDRVPVEYIKFMALQEPWPTEFFCDHRTGEYWYVPRGLDCSALINEGDPTRFYRTYFHCNTPSEVVKKLINYDHPHPAQTFLVFREESSTINWRSNIIVMDEVNQYFEKTTGIHLKLVPQFLKNRAFAATYYTVVDNLINNDSTELLATAVNFARLYGKELKAASMHVIGDPSLCPGECIQVIGSPLYGGGLDGEAYLTERQQIQKYYDEGIKPYLTLGKQIVNNAGGPANNYDQLLDYLQVSRTPVQMASLSHAQTMCPLTFTGSESNNDADLDNSRSDLDGLAADPRTLWRIEAIIHKFNNTPGDGWKTEVALLTPW